MEALFEKLKEYLHMDTEIPFEEFSAYYRSLMDILNGQYQSLGREDCLQARYICSIVQANADSRTKQSKTNAKVYKKMSGKCSFWADAIAYRLRQEGMSQGEIDQATQELNDSI